MGGYAVDAAELRLADAVLQQSERHGRTALAGLTAAADQLLDSRWSSPAAAAFRLGWADWTAAAHSALDALAALGHAVGLAGQGYEGTEDDVQAAVARTTS